MGLISFELVSAFFDTVCVAWLFLSVSSIDFLKEMLLWLVVAEIFLSESAIIFLNWANLAISVAYTFINGSLQLLSTTVLTICFSVLISGKWVIGLGDTGMTLSNTGCVPSLSIFPVK